METAKIVASQIIQDYDDGNKRLSTDQIRELQLRTKLRRVSKRQGAKRKRERKEKSVYKRVHQLLSQRVQINKELDAMGVSIDASPGY